MATMMALLLVLLLLLLLASRGGAAIGVGGPTEAEAEAEAEAESAVDACAVHPLTCGDLAGGAGPTALRPFALPPALGAPGCSRVLFAVAHPDDIATCAAGTVALLVRRGVRVRYVVMTSGDKGSSDPRMTSARLARIRHAEQLAAAKALGVEGVDFFWQQDGELTDDYETRRNLTRVVREFRPHAIVTWDPLKDPTLYPHYLEHRDHRASGQIALDTCYPSARDHLFFPELGLPTWNVPQAYLFSWRRWSPPAVPDGTPGTDFYADITSTMDDKIKSMLCHKSQVHNATAEIDYLHNMGAALAKATPGPANISALDGSGDDDEQDATNTIKYAEWFKHILFPA